MKVFPKLISDKTVTTCAGWYAAPAIPVFGDSECGLMLEETPSQTDGTLNRIRLSHMDLPEGFLTHELITLASGSEEKIAKITSKYGLLVSPYLYKAHGAIYEYASHSMINGDLMAEIQWKKYRDAITPQLSYADSAEYDRYPFGISLDNAARDTHDIIENLLSEGIPIRGMVASFREIREVAEIFIDTVNTIASMTSEKSTAEIFEHSHIGLSGLNFIGDCLKDIERAPGYILVDEMGRQIIEERLTYEEYKRLREGVGEKLLLRSLKPTRHGTLTEAVAAMIKNIAESGRTWDYCAHCGRLFPLSPGQLRKVNPDFNHYCSPQCRSGASSKRNRQASAKPPTAPA